MKSLMKALVAGTACAFIFAPSAYAVTINLTVVDSTAATSPFGVLFDGSNIWYSTGVGGSTILQVNQNTAGMPLTGVTRNLTGGGTGAMAWDGTNFVSASGTSIYIFNAATGALITSRTMQGVSGFSLIDGLDVDHGEVFFSPDVGNIYRLSYATGAQIGVNPIPYPPGVGFSGIERVDVGGNTYGIYVNDAFTPRKLCVGDLVGTEIGCATLPNSRYEDIAFDGRFIYAADLFGNRLDKIDLCVDTGSGCNSIFQEPGQPSGVPEPGTLVLLGAGLLGFAGFQRLKKRG